MCADRFPAWPCVNYKFPGPGSLRLRENENPLGLSPNSHSPRRPARGGSCGTGVKRACPDYKCVITSIRIIVKCYFPRFSDVQRLSHCWRARCKTMLYRRQKGVFESFVYSSFHSLDKYLMRACLCHAECLLGGGGVRMRTRPSLRPQGVPSLPGRTVRGDRTQQLLWGVAPGMRNDGGQVEQRKAPHPACSKKGVTGRGCGYRGK